MNSLHRPLVIFSLFVCGLSLAARASAETVSPTTHVATKLVSGVYKLEDLKVKPTDVGERRNVFDQPTVTLEKFSCHVTTLNSGKTPHPPHRHAQEEFIILKEGALEVFLNGKTQKVGPGSLLFFGSNDLHSVLNVGDAPATYLVFNLVTAATHTVTKSAAEVVTPDMLGSAVFDWNELKPVPMEVGFRRALVEKPTLTCTTFEGHITTLNPGLTSHTAHRHPDEEIVVMKEGVLDVTINGKTERVGPGAVCFFSSNDYHGVKTVGTTPATYFAIRFATAATPTASAPHTM
ncbi:MAG: cupin domain-containing protein [Verrucomicrobia bacterium]|nr:cupin domain-containing protein [Verrucomicrobiota bacterium]